MAQVNAYGYGAVNNTKSSTQAGAYTNSVQGGSNTLDINDFMTLLAAQLANQDVMNPSTDTEFIGQMAQFTSLQAMQTLTEISYAQYGASMIGKKVLVATTDEAGRYKEDQGTVESVKFAGGDCLVVVNGKEYTMSSIMEVVTEFKDPDDDESGGGESGGGEKPEQR